MCWGTYPLYCPILEYYFSQRCATGEIVSGLLYYYALDTVGNWQSTISSKDQLQQRKTKKRIVMAKLTVDVVTIAKLMLW